MQLYEVIRWGNDSDDPLTGGSSGPDTCFLVRADAVEQAATLVDKELARTPSELVRSWAGAVYLLGTDAASGSNAQILRGPYIQNAYRYGWRHWYRDERDEPWTEKFD